MARKCRLAMLLSLLTVTALVFLEGVVLRWQGLITSREPRMASVTSFSLSPSQRIGLSVFWPADPGSGSRRRDRLGLHELPLGCACEVLCSNGVAPKLAIWTGQGQQVVIGGPRGTLYTWDASRRSEAPQRLHKRPGNVRTLVASSDGRWLAVADDMGLALWDLHSRRLCWQRYIGADGRLAFHPVTQNLIATQILASGPVPGELLELDLQSGRALRVLVRHGGRIESMAITPDGKHVASIGLDGHLMITDWDSANRTWTSRHAANAQLCFSPCGKILASSCFDETDWSILLWDADSGRQRAQLSGHTKMILGMTFAADGTLYSWSSDGTLRHWDVERLEEISSFSPALAHDY